MSASSRNERYRPQQIHPLPTPCPRPVTWRGQFIPASTRDDEQSASRRNSTITEKALCPQCQNIGEILNGDRSQETKVFMHYETGRDLGFQYLQGCHLCTLIFHSLYKCANERKLSEFMQEAKSIRIEMQPPTTPGKAVVCKLVPKATLLPDDRLITGIQLDVYSSYPTHYGDVSYRVMDCPTTQLEIIRAMQQAGKATSTSSEHMLALAAKWIHSCVVGHDSCNVLSSSRPPPSRLLDISDSKALMKVKLVQFDQDCEPVKYAALSYCWGGNAPYKLQSSTVKDLYAGVRLEKLPKTIQDAISIAADLGLEWMWVDSLCILQDSNNDWTEESDRIGDIYGGCYVCIAAQGAATSEEGIYCERDPLIYQPCRISSRVGDQIHYVLPHHADDISDCLEEAALSKRGWAMQERLLAPRTIYFGAMLMWECREQLRAENSTDLGADHRNLKELFRSAILVPEQSFEALGSNEPHIYRTWLVLRRDYTKARLSFPSDRLTAIKGIINAIVARTGWVCYAGLWYPFMLEELLWAPLGPGSRALRWPTWSWTAVTEEVSTSGGFLQELATVASISSTSTKSSNETYMAIYLLCEKLLLPPHHEANTSSPEMTEWRNQWTPDIRHESHEDSFHDWDLPPISREQDGCMVETVTATTTSCFGQGAHEAYSGQKHHPSMADTKGGETAGKPHQPKSYSTDPQEQYFLPMARTQKDGIAGLVVSPSKIVPGAMERLGFYEFDSQTLRYPAPALRRLRDRLETVILV